MVSLLAGDGVIYRGSGSFTTGPERRSTNWFVRISNVGFRHACLTKEAVLGIKLREEKMVMMKVACNYLMAMILQGIGSMQVIFTCEMFVRMVDFMCLQV